MTTRAEPIILRGVRVHNLKGIDLDLPRDRWIVVTGVSGSGKSSLAFDTLYAEGQRRYIETFSPYTRQFLEALDKPDADRIANIPPAIGMSQRPPRRSGRSTVGTLTEIHEHLAVLYARAGRVACLGCGEEVRPADPGEVVRALEALPERTRYQVAFPLDLLPESDRVALADSLRSQGFLRVRVDGQVVAIGDGPIPGTAEGPIDVIVDRLVRGSEDPSRRLDSIETAFAHGLGRCRILTDAGDETFYRGWRCRRCGREATSPEPGLFRFNSPLGACPTCEGFGAVIDLDLDRIVPDRSKSLADGAILPWTTPAHRKWHDDLIRFAQRSGIPTDRPFQALEERQIQAIVEGSGGFPGLRGFLRKLESKSYKMHVRVFLSRWRSYRTCSTCLGTRLRPEALAVRVNGKTIAELSAATVAETSRILEESIAKVGDDPAIRRALSPVLARLGYIRAIGLEYLTLDRLARTLSGGEAQRVALTTALGSGLANTLYVLDEPSIGLHPRDVGRLIAVLRSLREGRNTVVVVEHDEALMAAADLLVDIGPGAGESGGRLLYTGPPEGVAAVAESPTGRVVSGQLRAAIPSRRRPADGPKLRLLGASGHNLKGMDVAFPLGVFCVVTGVSGSGKSTLVEETLYPALLRELKEEFLPVEAYGGLEGADAIGDVLLIDQAPIGRSGRSNPVTYVKAFDEIRKVFAETHEAKVRDYKAGRFSFNVEGGRCNACEGNGFQTIDMQFLADVVVRCPECHGTRFRPETLEVAYRGKNIAEVLELTVREGFAFFKNRPKVQARLRSLLDVGLDYLRLGQPAPTLSGGEAQRLKLAAHLATSPASLTRRADRPRTLFLLDEPTTGLHPVDVAKLLDGLSSLVDQGHTLIVVEHSPLVMATADWLIDLGPEAGEGGGRVVAEGTPEDVARSGTHTGVVLAEYLSAHSR